MEQPQVFYTYEWAVAVQRAYSGSLEPLIVLCYEEGQLRGIAALATDRHKRAFFLASSTADYCDFVSEPEFRECFLRLVLAEVRRRAIANLVLANLPATSVSQRVMQAVARENDYHVFTRPAYSCARVAIRSEHQAPDVKSFIAKKVRRKLLRLEREGAVTLINLSTWEDVRVALPRFQRAHIGRFLSTGRISNQVTSQRRVFLEELAELLSEPGWMCLSELTVAGRAIAWNYGFRYEGSWFWYQPTFDTDFEQLSPGYCLLGKIVEQSCESNGINIVDLGLGDEEYKNRFSNSEQRTVNIALSRHRAIHFGVRLRYISATTLKKFAPIEKGTRSAIEAARVVNTRIRHKGTGGLIVACARRVWNSTFGRDEVRFYEYSSHSVPRVHEHPRLLPIDLGLLSRAAMVYENERETIQYLLRAASRLQSGGAQGFALVEADSIPVHFCWLAPFEGFYMDELSSNLTEPAPGSVLVFDCWTPVSRRGHGYYGIAVQLLCSRARAAGNNAWIFSAATNVSSVRGLEKAGFQSRFSLVRTRFAGVPRIKQVAGADAAEELRHGTLVKSAQFSK
jgi:CelD/BcsL family acetyltransferase involved in cellulose biosynthesis